VNWHSGRHQKTMMWSVVRAEIESVARSMCILKSNRSIEKNSTVTDDEIVIPSTPAENDIND
jgi:hypothetical protein